MSKPKNMTAEREAEWIERRRAIARACYSRNADSVKAKVSIYKRLKRLKRAERAILNPPPPLPSCHRCGTSVKKNEHARNRGVCNTCHLESTRVLREEEEARFFSVFGCTRERAKRKWYKFVCKAERYDPSVYIDSTFNAWTLMQIERTEVLSLLPFHETREQGPNGYRLKGYYRWNPASHGFFSDNGKNGIHSISCHRSEMTKAFWQELRAGAIKGHALAGESRIKADRGKAQPFPSTAKTPFKPRKLKWRDSSTFFQNINTAFLISQYSKTA